MGAAAPQGTGQDYQCRPPSSPTYSLSFCNGTSPVGSLRSCLRTAVRDVDLIGRFYIDHRGKIHHQDRATGERPRGNRRQALWVTVLSFSSSTVCFSRQATSVNQSPQSNQPTLQTSSFGCRMPDTCQYRCQYQTNKNPATFNILWLAFKSKL